MSMIFFIWKTDNAMDKQIISVAAISLLKAAKEWKGKPVML